MKKLMCQIVALIVIIFQFTACGDRANQNDTQNDDSLELQSVLINKDSIHYIDVGEGQVVIFVHGGVGDYRVWLRQIEEFRKTYRVIAYSRRYAYPNKQVYDETADYTVAPHAEDLVELIRKISPENPVHLVGHSYGAFTSLWATMNNPQLVQTLTLGEPPVMSLLEHVSDGKNQLNDFFMSVLMPSIEAFKIGNEEEGASIFVNGVVNDSTYYSRVSSSEKQIILDNTLEMKGGLLSEKADPKITCDNLAELRMPILLITGDKSPVIFRSIIDVLDSCLVDSKSVILPETAHGLEIENPKDFNKAVYDFISKSKR